MSRFYKAIVVVAFVAGLGTLATLLWRETVNGPAHKTGMAVEFMDHAAAAYVAHARGWYREQGLNLTSYTSYATGMALAAALAKDEIQIAYMCLVPAINAYANGGIPIKIVAGTHRYGYALVVNPNVVKRVENIAHEGVRIGCVREGGAVDVLMNRTIDKYKLDRDRILKKVRRMNPSKLLLAIAAGRLDAAFLPEQWASMAEDLDFTQLLSAQDVWPGMQGSVVVVKEELIRGNPKLVRNLVTVTARATQWINTRPEGAARLLTQTFAKAGETLTAKLTMDRDMLQRSMKRLEYTTAISIEHVQEVIDYIAKLGYIKAAFPAEKIIATSTLP